VHITTGVFSPMRNGTYIFVKVGPVNNVLSSLFESLEMRINDKQITESGRYYPYRVQVLPEHFALSK
jgi:hypothetical protein